MASKENTNLKTLYTAWAAAFFGFISVTFVGIIYIIYNVLVEAFSFTFVIISVSFFLSALVLLRVVTIIDSKIQKVFGCKIKGIIDERGED